MLNSFLHQHMAPLIFAICAFSKAQQPHLTTFLLKLPLPFFFFFQVVSWKYGPVFAVGFLYLVGLSLVNCAGIYCGCHCDCLLVWHHTHGGGWPNLVFSSVLICWGSVLQQVRLFPPWMLDLVGAEIHAHLRSWWRGFVGGDQPGMSQLSIHGYELSVH